MVHLLLYCKDFKNLKMVHLNFWVNFLSFKIQGEHGQVNFWVGFIYLVLFSAFGVRADMFCMIIRFLFFFLSSFYVLSVYACPDQRGKNYACQ